MIIINGKNEIEFNWLNVIDFWLIGFVLVETKKTFEEKYIN